MPNPARSTVRLRHSASTGQVVFAVAAALALSLAGVFAAPQSVPAPRATTVADPQVPLATIKQYCATCHSERVKSGGVSFEGLTADGVTQHADVFEKAIRKVRGRVMPPPGAKQPDAATADALV